MSAEATAKLSGPQPPLRPRFPAGRRRALRPRWGPVATPLDLQKPAKTAWVRWLPS